MNNTLGLYIHIPYCRSKCPYCDFFSMSGKSIDYKNYVELLKSKIAMWSKKINKQVDTIYFGGGTPSVLGAELICEVLDCISENFSISENAEITMETNPSSGKFFDFSTVKKYGVSRVSLGLQSANDNELKLLGRTHSLDDVKNALNLIKSSGIKNISLDLMLGIPEQTEESLSRSIDFCSNADIEHISSYILKIEEGTIFDKRHERYSFPDEDKTADLYLFAVEYLKSKGFNQYEISNFSKEGFESKHNLKYWNLEDYLGIGPAAHSFVDNKRFYYARSIEDFAENKIIDDGLGGTAEEYVMLRLRLSEGLNLQKYKEAFGELPSQDFFNKIKKYCKAELMKQSGNSVCFTPRGFLVSNSIIADLI